MGFTETYTGVKCEQCAVHEAVKSRSGYLLFLMRTRIFIGDSTSIRANTYLSAVVLFAFRRGVRRMGIPVSSSGTVRL